jgi:tetratricopeptide (TPR) repeat protein
MQRVWRPSVLSERWVSGRAKRRLALARYWLAHGDLDEAARHGTLALGLARRCRAAPLALLADTALTMAEIDRDRGRYAAGEECLAWAVRQLDAAVATDDRDRLLAGALQRLGDAYRLAGRYEQAVPALERALRLAEPAVAREPAALAAALTSLGITAKELGAYEWAAHFYDRVQRVQSESGASTADEATLQHNLAGLAYARQQYRLAESFASRAVALREKVAGPHSVQLAQDLAVLAAAVAGQGRHDEARALLRRAMANCEAARPPRQYEIAVHLHNLAAIEQECGQPDEARRLYRQALSLKERLLGPDHPEIALVANNLATLLRDQQRHSEAADLLHRALSIAEATLPAGHPTTEAIRRNLDGLTGQR